MGTGTATQFDGSENEPFEFGANWKRFLSVLSEERIAAAEASLTQMLGLADLNDRTFLDVGSGSGLFSLAAYRLGAQVCSFDVDLQSVACTAELREIYRGDKSRWRIERGSVLDLQFVEGLGKFDVVYSWGVLHHTGAMWQALKNVTQLVNGDGKLFISIYNDQGGASGRWAHVKRLYNKVPSWFRLALVLPIGAYLFVRSLLISLIRLQNPATFFGNRGRGMSYWHDLVDWVGGYPFEVAKPEQIFDLYRSEGFVMERLTTCSGGHACNEFVFRRTVPKEASTNE